MFNFRTCLLLICVIMSNILLASDFEVLTANQYPNKIDVPFGQEGNEKILAGIAQINNAGAVINVFFENKCNAAISLTDIVWDSKNASEWSKDYQLIWYRMQPAEILPGKIGSISFCLREAIQKKTKFSFMFDSKRRFETIIAPEMPDFRIATIAFEQGLKKAFIYVEKNNNNADIPDAIFFDGKLFGEESVKWLNDNYTANVRIAEITFPNSLKRGERHNFIVQSSISRKSDAATMRAFDNLSVFGTYGVQAFERYARNGLNGYNSFGFVNKSYLDQAEKYGIKVVSKDPAPEVLGHNALYAYLLRDEPDCADYFVKDNRPISKKIGTLAVEMVEINSKVQQQDTKIPTILTLDLTFLPYNYFIYSQIADITNPDIYTVTTAWGLKVVDYHMQYVKRSCFPRPFAFTYQGCWEECTKEEMPFTNRSQILKIGWDKLRNKEKIRGFGRPPVPEEVRIPMLYAIGNGACGLFSFWDVSSADRSLLFHGSEDLPEIWEEIGRTSKALRRVKSLLEISHPVKWCKSKNGKVLPKTLFTGTKAALVIAINESYQSIKEGFFTKEAKTSFSFRDTPWLNANKVYRVTATKLTELNGVRINGELSWDDKLHDGEIYLITSDASIADKINSSANNELKEQQDAISMEQRNKEKFADQWKLIQTQGYSIKGIQSGGYAKTEKLYVNPDNELYNAFEFWEKEGAKIFSVKWDITVTAEMVNIPYTIGWNGQFSGAECNIEITRDKDIAVYSNKLTPHDTNEHLIEVSFPEAGIYNLNLYQKPSVAGEHGMEIANSIFMIKSQDLLKKQPKALSPEQRDKEILADKWKLIQTKGIRIKGIQSGGYAKTEKLYVNPDNELYNAFEFWEKEGTKLFSVKWDIAVTAEMVNTPYTIGWNGQFSGAECNIEITMDKDAVYSNRLVMCDKDEHLIEVSFPKPGNYSMDISQKPSVAGEHGMRIANSIFMIKSQDLPK